MRSGAAYSSTSRPDSSSRSMSRASSPSSVELRNAAWTPLSSSAPTWSCISAISGLTTSVTPRPARCRTIAGT
jgi:hypothetical protein